MTARRKYTVIARARLQASLIIAAQQHNMQRSVAVLIITGLEVSVPRNSNIE
jgi:hypothetical protein